MYNGAWSECENINTNGISIIQSEAIATVGYINLSQSVIRGNKQGIKASEAWKSCIISLFNTDNKWVPYCNQISIIYEHLLYQL